MGMTVPSHPLEQTPSIENSAIRAASSERRRALVRQYKEARPAAGIFLIRNKINGCIYLGGSLNLKGVMNRHRFELNLRSHRNKRLQLDWIAHGAENFSIEVLDRIKEQDDPDFDYASELANLLTLWRDEYPCDGKLSYNGATP
ncbi:group I intron endonuclease [compost metagenome]